MITKITVCNSVGPCVFPGAGDVIPIVGISPASAETERTQVKAKAKVKRFMGVTPYLRKSHANLFISSRIRAIPQHFLQGRAERTNITFVIAQLLANRKSQSHADCLSEAGHVSPDRKSSSRSPMSHCVRAKRQKRI